MTSEITRLNNLLGDGLGLNPYGEPRYKWVQAGDLTIPVRITHDLVLQFGLYIPQARLETRPQLPMCDSKQWVLAMWAAPDTLGRWKQQFGSEAGYNARGCYIATDCICNVGKSPIERLTRNVMGAVKNSLSMNYSEYMAHHDGQSEKAKRDYENTLDAWIGDKMTAFGEVPGSRGGLTSFPEKRPGLKEAVKQ